MKLYKLLFVVFAGLAIAACSDIDNVLPESGTMLASQVQNTNVLVPSRAEAAFPALFVNIGKPIKMYSTPDDWEFLMILFCNDLEGADAWIPDSGYNWFSVCGEYSSRTPSYRNPAIRYRAPYNMIGAVNDFLAGYPEDVSDASSLNLMAQAKCLRAWSYMFLVNDFQFSYAAGAQDKPSVPMINADTDMYNNPRATVAEVYAQVMDDLNWAIEHLGTDRTTKAYVNSNVAYGLRARANLAMQNWAAAASDAEKAAAGYTPASIEEVSVPSFMDISEHNWIWGYDMTTDRALSYRYATTSSWLRSFSAWGYAPACQCYTCVNDILYNKIPDSDVRKGWWVDKDLMSPLLDGLKWPGFDDVANADDGGDAKLPYIPYTNVKFGCYTVGTTSNDEDFPLMRVEEMILIQAEAYAKSGNESKAKEILENFVKTYRDPSYSIYGRSLSLADEIWFQRRVELWGEGFYTMDANRLNKPIVRFTDASTSVIPAAFRFNLASDNPWRLMRFAQGETNTNMGIVNNEGGQQPVTDEGASLRDGVTD